MAAEVLRTLQAAVEVDGRRVTIRRGQEIPDGISDRDRQRLKGRGSIVSPDELAAEEAAREAFRNAGDPNAQPYPAQGQEPVAPPTVDVSASSEEDLAAHIAGQKLNVDDTVALAAGDPDLAARVLVAEESASGGNPRKGVVEGLEKIGS